MYFREDQEEVLPEQRSVHIRYSYRIGDTPIAHLPVPELLLVVGEAYAHGRCSFRSTLN